MAIPVFQSAGAGDATTGVSGAPAYPASIVSGDMLLLHVLINMTIDDETVSTPSGWSLETGPFTQEFQARGYLFSKIADGSETGTMSLTYSTGTGNGKAARIYRFTGNATSSAVEGANSSGDTGNSIAMGSVTTSGTDRLAVACLAIAANTTAGSATGETGGNWVEALAEFSAASGGGVTVQLQTADMPSAGTITGGLTALGTGTTVAVNKLAIKPVPAVPPTATLAWITA